jgi:acyl transferase domain-containing protein
MLSPTGRFRMWDAGADGYARGEGFATVVLKPLTQALADGDHIETIIREIGVNQDGRSAGLTVPSSISQASLIQSTYLKCGLDYRKAEDRCQYFEAHGTGTTVGDPKEAEAISRTFFADNGQTHNKLYVGSAKSVIGHSEGAAGLASLLKASLAIQNCTIPPNLHFERLNPAIEPFYGNISVPKELLPWPNLPHGVPRRASINSFGFGGTNAHAIIESWDQDRNEAAPPLSKHMSLFQNTTIANGPILLSANSRTALRGSIESLSNALKTSKYVEFDALAWISQFRRTEFRHRVAFAALTGEDLQKALLDYLETPSEVLQQGTETQIMATEQMPLRVLGVFTGQGAQWPRMGTALYQQSSHFRLKIQDFDESLQGLRDPPDWSLASLLQARVEQPSVHCAEISQPLTTAIQVALVELLKACGVCFAAVMGHSSGEIAAVYTSGYLNGRDAIRIAYYRGIHSAHATCEEMMAVGMNYHQALLFCSQPQFSGRLKVAASNSLSSGTLSGDINAVDEACDTLHANNIFARVLNVEKAYHSHHMDSCSSHYLASL